MKHHILCVLLCGVLLLGLFAGCSQAGVLPDNLPEKASAHLSETPTDHWNEEESMPLPETVPGTAVPTEPETEPETEPVPIVESSYTPETDPEPEDIRSDTLVVAADAFNSVFHPFYCTASSDTLIASDLTQVFLLCSDREGYPVLNGIEGESRPYNGVNYTYHGIADCEITENANGTVDYRFTLRDDVQFSDGQPLTVDDVLFSLYSVCDPVYDGPYMLYDLPIAGMDSYRAGMDSLGNVIFAAGSRGYSSNSLYTKDQYDAFWIYYNNQAGPDFAQEIVDYCMRHYAGYGALDVTSSAALWGFELEEDATVEDFWNAILEAYDGDIEAIEGRESAGSTLCELTIAGLGPAYEVGVKTGRSADSISGIRKTGDRTFTVHMTAAEPTAIYSFVLPVLPMHYYGDPGQFNGTDSFGFPKGDLRMLKAKTAEPLGAGPYRFVSYSSGKVRLEANERYWKGKPLTENILVRQLSAEESLYYQIYQGHYDISAYAVDSRTASDLFTSADYLYDKKLAGKTVGYAGYGYIGINASAVNVGGSRDSEASKNLRKAFATVFAAYREEGINSYYGTGARVIDYPLGYSSWIAPKELDPDYETAFSRDVNGDPIYRSSMSESERYEAALQAALGYFEAAGFSVRNGTVSGVPAYTILIPGDGTGDHPSYWIAEKASEALASIGVTLKVYDASNSNELWDGLDANTIQMWAAAWASSVDPEMYRYHSDNVSGHGTGSNHYYLTSQKLDQLIMDAWSSTDRETRKALYRQALDEILDWGVEVPVYQRLNAFLVSAERVDLDTLTPDLTPFWSWTAEVEALQMH